MKSFRSFSGTSLVETLVSMSLLGVILIPMLFLSSAFFLAQLAKSRQNVDVGVNAARFSNQLMEELYLTQRILPDSTTTELHFAFYDQVQQRAIKRGYRLTDSGNYRILHKLSFHDVDQSWRVLSPYGGVAAEQVLLPSTAVFTYCTGTDCAGIEPEKASYLRLVDWDFMPTKNTQRVLDFPDIDIYLSSGATAGGIMMANVPQEIYSFSKNTSFGITSDLKLVHLNTTGQKFNYAYLQTASNPGLSTILSGVNTPGSRSTKVSMDGRVYFAQNASPGSFWTWREGSGSGTGLSTIISGVANLGFYATAVWETDGRLYFGQNANPGSFYTWKEGTGAGTGLSTIVSGVTEPGRVYATAVSPVDGRVFFGQNESPGSFWTWKVGSGSGTGLSTIISGVTNPGYYTTTTAADGRVFFGQYTDPGNIWTWTEGNGLSTILSGIALPGVRSLVGSPLDGRVFIGQEANPGTFWTWKVSTGLSTILSGVANPGVYSATAAALDGRVYFGQNAAAGRFFTWKEGTGTGTGLSTIVTGIDNPGVYSIATSGYDNRVFFGQGDNPSSFYTWKEGTGAGTGLSTLVSGVNNAGQFATEASSYDGRVFFGQNASPGSLWTWKENKGLSTIFSAVAGSPGLSRATAVSPVDGRGFFGHNANPGNFWTWRENVSASISIPRVSVTGSKTSQPLTATLPPATLNYTSSFQDAYGELYLCDATAKTIDRYIYSGTAFARKTYFDWSTNTDTVGAIVVDQGKSGIALLDTTNKQIDYYSDRKTTGTATAANQYALSDTTTPTGLAVSGRTGNYLVIDSDLQGSSPNKYIRLFVYDESGNLQSGSPYRIFVDDSAAEYPLSVDATSETNFKIHYDDKKNILYLVAPTVGQVYAIGLPTLF